jgi:hypothetical protein
MGSAAQTDVAVIENTSSIADKILIARNLLTDDITGTVGSYLALIKHERVGKVNDKRPKVR